MKIQEIIVVEGKHDSDRLHQYFDCDTIETGGLSLDEGKLEMIKQAQAKRGVIIFTDPDTPGEKIRMKINQYIPDCKNAYVKAKDAKTKRKVGIEHASREVLEESLTHLFTYRTDLENTLAYEEFLDLGLNGAPNSAEVREALGERLLIGRPNAKTLYKRLNMLQMTKAEVEALLEEII